MSVEFHVSQLEFCIQVTWGSGDHAGHWSGNGAKILVYDDFLILRTPVNISDQVSISPGRGRGGCAGLQDHNQGIASCVPGADLLRCAYGKLCLANAKETSSTRTAHHQISAPERRLNRNI